MNWSKETYRLNEIGTKCEIPCVIHVNEGYYSETGIDSFSQGDVIGIDRRMTLHKVAANFTNGVVRSKIPSYTDDSADSGYCSIAEEILIPINYKGKLKVCYPRKRYSRVSDLASDSPRYAQVLENLNVPTNRGPIKIPRRSRIELDRIIPTSKGSDGKLVVYFEQDGETVPAALPLSQQGLFMSEEDYNEYTISEAIDRYQLPQVVSFVNDEIRKVYTQDLLEGIESMGTITKKVKLNRLVTQNVLVGHYKPVEGASNCDTEHFRKRTLIVLPLDHPDIWDIEVNVLQGGDDVEDVYQDVFLVQSAADDLHLVDSLYVEFAKRPAIQIIETDKDEQNDYIKPVDRPPPVPRRHNKPANSESIPPARPPKPGGDYVKPTSKTLCDKPAVPVRAVEDDSYEDMSERPVPPPSTPSARPGAYGDIGFTLLGTAFTNSGPSEGESQAGSQSSGVKRIEQSVSNLFNKLKSPKTRKSSISEHQRSSVPAQRGVLSAKQAETDDNLEIVYDDIDDANLDTGAHIPAIAKALSPFMSDLKQKLTKPVGHVKPTSTNSPSKSPQLSPKQHKRFHDLSDQELVERLQKCHMIKMAEICEREHLDGSFFKSISDVELEKDFELMSFELVKFKKMRDENWVVNEG